MLGCVACDTLEIHSQYLLSDSSSCTNNLYLVT